MSKFINDFIHEVAKIACENTNTTRGYEQDYHLAITCFLTDEKSNEDEMFFVAKEYFDVIIDNKKEEELVL